MKYSSPANRYPWVLLAASLIVSFGIWRWALQVLAPTYTAKAVAHGRPIGNNSDLYPVWLTAHEVLLRHQDPYSPQLTRDIQKGFYGRELDPQNPDDPTDLQAFVYPLYVVFIFAPTITLPFSTVAEVFRWLFLLFVAVSVPLWISVIGVRWKPLFIASAMVLAVSNFPAVLEERQENLTAFVVLLLSGAAAALARHWLTLSGFLLALSTIKPQLSGLLVCWALLWALSNFGERKRLIWGFVSVFISLIAAATVVSPHWFKGLWAALRLYQSYRPDPSLLQALFPSMAANVLSAALLVFTGLVCWKWRKAPIESPRSAWTIALLVSVTVALNKQAAHYQLLLVPALLVLLNCGGEAAKTTRYLKTVRNGVSTCLIWQWATALILALWSLVTVAPRAQRLAELPLFTSLALSVITLCAVLMATFRALREESNSSSKLATEFPKVAARETPLHRQ